MRFKDGSGKDWQLFGSVCAESAYLSRRTEVCGCQKSLGYEANAIFCRSQYLEDYIGCVGSDLFGNYQGSETARFFARTKGFFAR